MTHANNLYSNYSSLKELDDALGAKKGTAFRCVKKELSRLKEGGDFVVLDASQYVEIIGTLRDQGRIYFSTVNLVLLSTVGRKKLFDAM